MKNEQVYIITKAVPWSKIIKTRRMKWLGHIHRLDKRTPAVRAMEYARKPYKKKRGRQKLTWLKETDNILKEEMGIDPLKVKQQAENKAEWRNLIKNKLI